jgi:hypothetical protein
MNVHFISGQDWTIKMIGKQIIKICLKKHFLLLKFVLKRILTLN